MIVDHAVYEHGRRRAEPVALEDTYEQCRREGVFAWIGLYEPTEEEFESVRREFDLHELAVEDAIKAHQRPKLEFYGDSLFVVLKTARWIDAEETIEFGEILVFVGDGFIISVRHGETDAARRAAAARGAPRAPGAGAERGALRDRRPGRRRLRAGDRGARQRRSARSRPRSFRRRAAIPPSASTS